MNSVETTTTLKAYHKYLIRREMSSCPTSIPYNLKKLYFFLGLEKQLLPNVISPSSPATYLHMYTGYHAFTAVPPALHHLDLYGVEHSGIRSYQTC